MTDRVAPLLARLPEPDEGSAALVRARAETVLRPLGALHRLDEVAVWLARWQRTSEPHVERPAAIVFVADHGVADEGVSAYPPEVTADVLRALRDGVATANAMARALSVALTIEDVGVGTPSGNLAREPALTTEAFAECFATGRRGVAGVDADVLVLGEMGIGNTTAASAVCTALYGGPAEQWTGRGTGIDHATYERKVRVVEAGVARIADRHEPLEILRELGGFELVAIAGALTEARLRSIPVLLDGFVVTSAAAALDQARPGALDHCFAGHRSAEPGHALLLEKLGMQPLLDLDLRLGEGSGALAALPLVKLAAACVTDVATFEEWGLIQ